MSKEDETLDRLGITLPEPPPVAGSYVPFVRTGNLVYLAGLGPAARPDGSRPKGKLGRDLSVEEGYEAARLTGINILARLKEAVGDFDRVRRIVKLLCMVNCTPDFTQPPAVANGCSDLLIEVLGERGRHARSAVGMSTLPGDIPIEIEVIVEVED